MSLHGTPLARTKNMNKVHLFLKSTESITYIATHEADARGVKRTVTTFPSSYPKTLAETVFLSALRQSGVEGEIRIKAMPFEKKS